MTPDQWLARTTGRYGGFLALLVVWLCWRATRLHLLFALVVTMCFVVFVSVPIVGLTARRNIKRGLQTRTSGWIQLGLALVATLGAWWTFLSVFADFE